MSHRADDRNAADDGLEADLATVDSRPVLEFFFIGGGGFSGQRFASQMLVDGLRRRGWRIRVVHTPVLDRVAERPAIFRWLDPGVVGLQLIGTWLQGIRAALSRHLLVINLGQTPYALLRDGFPLLVRSWLPRPLRTQRGIISLHGSLFQEWDRNSYQAKMLRRLSQSARFVTVLGPRQVDRLAELGIDRQKLVHMDNTCRISAVSEQQCRAKQALDGRPLRVLYLSSLIESKGFREFVDAIELLAQRHNTPIHATLCGSINTTNSPSGRRYLDEVRDWLTKKLESINRSREVRLTWIEGADGADKERLFRDAHVFVLPTVYKNEAQPIALLEAMASGCVIVTSDVGEIPNTVDSQSAILLKAPGARCVADSIEQLRLSADQRLSLTLRGLVLFRNRFSFVEHIRRWEQLLDESNVEIAS